LSFDLRFDLMECVQRKERQKHSPGGFDEECFSCIGCVSSLFSWTYRGSEGPGNVVEVVNVIDSLDVQRSMIAAE
jgi:hypothetical protein